MTLHPLGPFRLDTQANLLLRAGEPVALGGRAVALLRALLERPGALVTKDALIEAAWPGQAVEESNLTVQIAALRRVLGEVPGGERWIETMPRRGYRLVLPAVAVDGLPAAAPAEPERRQIVALSCELSADSVGLDEMRATVGAFHVCIARTAERHRGFVASRLGNAALILFGYPEAAEHDAERAVRAGLELCAAVAALPPHGAAPVQCRAGIATGMAIVGDLNAPAQREIVGDAPTLAARLQLSAPLGGVAIEAATRRLIGDLFACHDLGNIDANGGTRPAPLWQVTGESAAISRFAALRGPALAPLIGRGEEADLLLRRWARARSGEGQVVLISGEPGIGKSRLVAALEEQLRGEPHARLRYACSPSRQDSALFPFIDQLGRAGAPAEDAALLADLLSLPSPRLGLSPQQQKARTLAALLRHIESLARRRPVLMVLEDAHWIDATSGELLDLVVERTRGLPVLLVLTFRPEFQPRWIGEPGVTVLMLNRLDRRDRISLAMQIAGKALPDAMVEQIANRTDGVPLFVEELTKSVLESGALRAEVDRYVLDGALPVAIPATLYASLRARLDRPGQARLVAQAGAAIGREFAYGLLRAVSPLAEDALKAALKQLVASELVFQRGELPDAVYSFKHALVQDVAHDSLLQDAREQLHADIVAALSPEVVAAQPEIVAQHYAEAGLAAQSADAWSQAGRRSAARSALAEAAAQYQKALDQLARLPADPERLRQELECRGALATLLRFVKGQAAPETGDAYARARDLWLRIGSPSGFLQVPYGHTMYHLFRGEVEVARHLAEDLLRLSAARQDAAGLVLGRSAAGQCHLLAGGFADARAHLEQVLALHDADSYATVQHAGSHPRMTQAFLGNALLCLGYPEQAEARSNAAIAEARQLAHPTSVAVSLVIGALQLSLTGDSTTLQTRAEELNAIATEQGLPAYRAWAAIYRGWARVERGDVVDGTALLRDGVTAYRTTGGAMWMPRFIAMLAAAHEIAGRLDRALALLEDAVAAATDSGERWFVAELYRQKARLLHRQGRADAAEEQYREALRVARSQHARLWELRAATGLAQLLGQQGHHGDAHALLSPVHGWFTEGFALADLRTARTLLDELER